MPTEAEWKARMVEKATALAPSRTINESYLRQAAVSSDLLTGHPVWDIYLQRLQVLLDEAQAGLAAWQGKLAGAYAEADLRKVQIEINVFTDRIATLTHCMEIPKEILTHAHDALDNTGK